MDFCKIKEWKSIFTPKKFYYFLDKVKGGTLAYAWNPVFSERQLSARFYCPTRPERAEARSPGHRPGYHRISPCALKGQKHYKAFGSLNSLVKNLMASSRGVKSS